MYLHLLVISFYKVQSKSICRKNYKKLVYLRVATDYCKKKLNWKIFSKKASALNPKKSRNWHWNCNYWLFRCSFCVFLILLHTALTRKTAKSWDWVPHADIGYLLPRTRCRYDMLCIFVRRKKNTSISHLICIELRNLQKFDIKYVNNRSAWSSLYIFSNSTCRVLELKGTPKII